MKKIQSVDKTMHILDYIAENNGRVTLTDISRSLGFAITTLHGFLTTLEAWNMLYKDAAGKYHIGAKLFQLSLYCGHEQRIRTAVHPYLGHLAQEFGETIHLGIRLGEQLTYADRAEPDTPFRTTSVAGETVPYYDSAIGLIIKVANNEDIPPEYLTNCNNLAHDGYCLKYEPDMKAYCLGVPFLQPGAPCMAGFSVVLPEDTFTLERAQRIAARISAVAREIRLV